MNNRLEIIEDEISRLCADRNAKIVTEFIASFQNSEGGLNPTGMWRLKNILLPREYDPPMAKKDALGNLITAPEALKNLIWKLIKKGWSTG